MDLTRRQLLHRGGAAALATPGIYALLGELARYPARAATTPGFPPEQHIMNGIQVITDNGVEVVVPPLHHQVVTASLTTETTKSSLTQAQQALESAIENLEQSYPDTPSGLGITVGWGQSYFRNYVPNVRGQAYPAYLPVDNRASAAAGTTIPAFLDAITFPSDPPSTILEQNDMMVLLRSDSLDNISAGAQGIFGALSDTFSITSIRRGFVGGGFGGGQSLPKQMAMAAQVPGAKFIPDTAELYLGFTSTQKAALGPSQIANFETIPGLTDQWPNGYWVRGTTMHLSHLFEDLETWYTQFNFNQQVTRMFRPGLKVHAGTQTVPEGSQQVESEAQVVSDAKTYGVVGHSATLQPATRTQADMTDNYGTFNPAGTAIPQRADFDTLDNPFAWTSRPRTDGYSSKAAAGLHFLVFAPTSDAFHRGRRAMDGHYTDGTVLSTASNPRSSAQGFNSVLTTTHRQNYLIPPRTHRSFPLVELI